MTSPYSSLPPEAFWRSAVADCAPLDPGALYRPRFSLTRETRVATAGSCFAQHVGRALRAAGCRVIDTEALPAAIPQAVAERFGYGLFSARYGNIYTVRQLVQLTEEALGKAAPADPVWERDGAFFDAQRPSVEPEGLPDADLVMAHRAAHLACVQRAFKRAEVFVFTLGLTETWRHTPSGTVYPTAPGTLAGRFDPAVHSLHIQDVIEVIEDFTRFRALMKAMNPGVRFLLTVSPVPLTATASGQHVEVANAASKATLRAACAALTARHSDIDYFPSYEVITSAKSRGAYFAPNLRSVSPQGVAAAMGLFLAAHGLTAAPIRRAATDARDAACEDALLEAFGQ